MDHNNCFPTIVRQTLAQRGSLYSRDMHPGNCEALLVTTCWPLKNFMCRLKSAPALSSQPANDVRNHRVTASVRPKTLEPHEEDVVCSAAARELLLEDGEFRDALKCRILIWNCSGICHCKFREAVRYIRWQFGVNIAIIIGGPTIDTTTDGFWGGVGLTEGIPWNSDFEGWGPSVTVRYDEYLMEVDYSESQLGEDGRVRQLNVWVDRPRFVEAIEWALNHNMEESSSDESDSDE